MKRWKLYCSFSLKCWPYYLTASATVYFQLWIKNVKFNNEYFWLSFSGEGCKQSNVSFLFSLKNKDNVAAFIAPVYKNNMYHKFAIFSSPSYGPTFGFGLDLFISNYVAPINNHSPNLVTHTNLQQDTYLALKKLNSSLLEVNYFTPTEIEVFY